jgi:GNAT superfamily N-acetyltransferase
MIIRPAHNSDATAISTLIRSLLADIYAHPDGIGAEAFLGSISAESIATKMANNSYQFWVAEQDGELIGEVAVRDQSHLLHLYVAQAEQGKGLARKLWQQACTHLRKAKDGPITVNSSRNAVPMYQHFGFEIAGAAIETNGIVFVPMQLRSFNSLATADSV